MSKLNKKKTILFHPDQVVQVEELVAERGIYGYNFSHFVREAVAEKLRRESGNPAKDRRRLANGL